MSEQDRRGEDNRAPLASIRSEADAPKASVETGDGDESNVPADAINNAHCTGKLNKKHFS
jgi:hypothetical protein